MAKINPSYEPIDGLKGSSQHHDLKNQPGEDAEEDHQHEKSSASEKLQKSIKDTEAETEIADAMRDAVKKDKA